MHDAAFVRPFQPLTNFNTVLQNLLSRERALRQAVSQRLPLQKLHNQEVDAILMADIMQSANVGMVQRRYGAGFVVETLPGLGIAGQMTREDFDRDGAVQASVLGAIHLAHAAGADGRKDFVRAEFCAHGKRHMLDSP